jgi:hypothetical protein
VYAQTKIRGPGFSFRAMSGFKVFVIVHTFIS